MSARRAAGSLPTRWWRAALNQVSLFQKLPTVTIFGGRPGPAPFRRATGPAPVPRPGRRRTRRGLASFRQTGPGAPGGFVSSKGPGAPVGFVRGAAPRGRSGPETFPSFSGSTLASFGGRRRAESLAGHLPHLLGLNIGFVRGTPCGPELASFGEHRRAGDRAGKVHPPSPARHWLRSGIGPEGPGWLRSGTAGAGGRSGRPDCQGAAAAVSRHLHHRTEAGGRARVSGRRGERRRRAGPRDLTPKSVTVRKIAGGVA